MGLEAVLSCSHEEGFFGSLARGTPRESFRWSSRAVGVWRWRAKLVGEATWLSLVKQVLSFQGKGGPLRATKGGSAPSGAPPQTSGCWWSRGPRVPIGRSSTELVIHGICSDNILTLRCPFKDYERSARCWVPFSPGSPGQFVD